MLHIGLEPEFIFRIAGFAVSNTLFTSLITSALLIVTALLMRAGIRGTFGTTPGQKTAEFVLQPIWTLTNQVLGDKTIAQKAFPFIATYFFFIVTANWLEILPGFLGSFYVAMPHGEPTPLLRSPSTDLNTTLALGLISVGFTQIVAIRALGLKRFIVKIIDIRKPIEAFVSILELFSEFSKIFSFAFRLFGNMFAGGVLLIVIGFLIPYVIPLPFMVLEIFVGLIQAFIFSILSLMFLRAALSARA